MNPTLNLQDPIVTAALADTPLSNEQSEAVLKNQTNWFDYKTACPVIKKLKDDYNAYVAKTYQVNTRLREFDFDVDTLRATEKLLSDETYIPVRVIDTNIKGEAPKYVSFLQGERLIALTPDGGESTPKVLEGLERRHRQLLTYPGWLQPWLSVIDGALVHGVDYIEVLFDNSYPGHVSIEHLGVKNIVLDLKLTDIQSQPLIMRRFNYSADTLREYSDRFGFTGVDELLTKQSAKLQPGDTIEVYKLFFRINGEVHTAWWCEQMDQSYLKAPAPTDLGLREKVMVPQNAIPMPMVDPVSGMPTMAMVPQPPKEEWKQVKLKQYPLFAYKLYITENPELMSCQGRAFLDKYDQAALTTGWSSFVNSMVRSSGTYASVSIPGGTKIAKSTIKLEHGCIYETPLNFFAPPPPDTNMLPMLQAIQTKNKTEAGQFNYAQQMKGGKTRPTATEVDSSEQATQQFASVGLSMFSELVRQVYTLTWRMLTNFAEQDNIFLYGNRQYTIDPVTNTGKEIIQNDKLVIKQPYLIIAAGDIDVVQRGQRIRKMLELWPTVAGTPLAGPYLAKLLKIALPEDGEMFASIIEQTSGMPPAELVAGLLKVVQATLDPGDVQGQPPEVLQKFQMLIQNAQAYVANSGIGQPQQEPLAQPQ